jgi:uncharacterized protein (TIGR02001 family)
MKGHNMKYAIPTCAVAALLAAAPVLAADEPAKEESPWTVTSNVALTNAYFFRGLNYSRERPALQGGFDISHSSGFYVGTWASNVDGNAFPDANIEIDVYGGYAKEFGEVLVDVGVLQFIYPGGKVFNTTELYAGATWGILNLKYSHAVSEYFGTAGTEGAGYIEGNVNYEFLPSWVANAHIGHQNVVDFGSLSFTQYRAGLTKNFDGGWSVSLQGIAVDAKDKTALVDFHPTAPKSLMDLNYQITVKRVF